jgi:hypothetical protein
MATPGALQRKSATSSQEPELFPVESLLRHTIFPAKLPVAVAAIVVTTVMWFATPPAGRGKRHGNSALTSGA